MYDRRYGLWKGKMKKLELKKLTLDGNSGGGSDDEDETKSLAAKPFSFKDNWLPFLAGMANQMALLYKDILQSFLVLMKTRASGIGFKPNSQRFFPPS